MPDNITFVDVILPLPIPEYFTYSVPEKILTNVCIGKRAVVPFGKKKLYTAIIANLHNNKPNFDFKEIYQIIDSEPIVNSIQLSFWQWIALYYMCTIGEVYKAAVPSGLKLESESVILPGDNFLLNQDFSENEIILIELLKKNGSILIQEFVDIVGKQIAYNIISVLSTSKIILVEESITEKFIPKYEQFVEFYEEMKSDEYFNMCYNKLSKSKKQAELLLKLAEILKLFSQKTTTLKKTEILKLLPGYSAQLKELQKKNIIKVYEKEVSRVNFNFENINKLSKLNELQNEAFINITEKLKEKDVVLLHGVTSSGKTEIYIHLINDCILKGKQVLYLLPEIALTNQIINRLYNVFGKLVGIYHSKYSDAERVETYLNVLKAEKATQPFKIILGVRSSVFLPFSNLGLIIVDEEHDSSYKQFDPAPRYNARDSAIMLAKMHGAKVILGSATPSIESNFNTFINKYSKVEILKRYSDIELPNIVIVDIKQEYKRNKMKFHCSEELINNIENTVNNKKQVILFQNRRGFSPWIECGDCGWIPGCKHCDVKLTYHKFENRLVCHYCGFSTYIPNKCPACNSSNLATKGFGTERIEDDLKIIFPNYKIERFDLDSTRTRKKISQIIENFETGLTQILVGTQMLSKGLDFNNVGLVGVLNADNLLNFPNFRANERSFQLLTQVSGRAGRKGEQGKVIIQTSQPEHPVIKHVINNDYNAMYNWQLKERLNYFYPPYSKIIEFIIKHKKEEIAQLAAIEFVRILKKIYGNNVIGPDKPYVSRIENYFLRHTILKIDKTKNINELHNNLINAINYIKKNEKFKSVVIIPDVDCV